MQGREVNSSKRSVTAPSIPRRSHGPSRNEESAPNLVKVNPYKIARATSFNVFMEYGATANTTGLDLSPVVENPRNDAPNASPSQDQKNLNGTETVDFADNSANTPFDSALKARAKIPNIKSSSKNVSPFGGSSKQRDDLRYAGSEDPSNKNKLEVDLSQSDQLTTTENPLLRKDIEANDVGIHIPTVAGSRIQTAEIPSENRSDKRKRGVYLRASNHDDGKSSGSLNSSFIINADSEFVPGFHFDHNGKHAEKRDATVIYTRKLDNMPKHGHANELEPQTGDHSSVNSPISESTNRTRTGVKSKYGSDLMSLNLSGQNNIGSEESLSKRLSASIEKLSYEKRINPGSPISKKFKNFTFSQWKVATAVSVSVFASAVLVGLLIAIYILSHGTRDSVNSYFNDGKNIPHLRELAAEYLFPGEQFGVVTNSIDGLSNAAKSDIEVTDLMKGVSNFMFHGIAYSPNNAMEPHCRYNKRDAMLDLAKISTVTTRIRTYGMQCDQAELIMEAIDHMNLNMTVAMGVWIGENDTINRQQMDMMKKVIAKHPDPARVINSIFIGNEVLFRGDKSKKELIEYIQDARRFLQLMKIDDIPVGTSEIGSLIDLELLINCDIVGANIQPFFGGVSVEDATHWVLRFLDLQILPHNENIGTPIVITEIGWPSGGGRYRYAQAGMSSLKVFLSTFLCTMRNLPLEYYFFEAYDEPWKEVFWTSNQKWETQWGIFNADRLNKFPLQNIGCMR